MDIPAELARRETCLQAIAEAKERILLREQERLAAEQAAYEKKLAERANLERETGKKHRGSKPKPPSRAINPKAQINLTDDESRIMPTGDGFVQAYNAQVAVDCDSLLLVSVDVSQSPRDVALLTSTVTQLVNLPNSLGTVSELLADAGYFSSSNVDFREANHITGHDHDLPDRSSSTAVGLQNGLERVEIFRSDRMGGIDPVLV